MAASEIVWSKSSASTAEENCVECASTGHVVLVRDSKVVDGGVVRVTGPVWGLFIDCVTEGTV
ncbi:DUF397 domain-containing protein [Streptomyces tendae]|uniref:DUF397 domain-containing protein n=1 Tax=Streptomyces tendae TaxID=1932 RepID=UPI00364C2FFB